MPLNNKPMALTAELVARVERTERDTSPEPGLTRLNDEDYDGIAEGLLRQYSPTTFWLFAYGSLIWKPEFTSLEHRRGIAYGWHRSFCLELKSWRGTPEVPGLMLALDRGGRCEGVVYRLPDNDHHDQLRRLLRRELGYREDVPATRWIKVRTDTETVRALVFYAGPRAATIRASGRRRRWRRSSLARRATWAPAPCISTRRSPSWRSTASTTAICGICRSWWRRRLRATAREPDADTRA